MNDPTRREIDRRNLRKIVPEHAEHRIRKFANYDSCPRCRALPGNPCRERIGLHRTALDQPHTDRPLKSL